MKSADRSLPALPKESYALGLGIAVTAGITLPQKADAVFVLSDDTAVVIGASDYINIRLDELSPTLSIGTQFLDNNTGWNLGEFGNGSNNYVVARGVSVGLGASEFAEYFFLQSGTVNTLRLFDSPTATAYDLANLSAGANIWTTGISSVSLPTPGTFFYVGLRKDVTTNGDTDSYYGWAHFEVGSIAHIQTAFNTAPNGSILVGQIPEPTSAALLLTAGLAGVTAFRRRRKK